MTRIHFTWPILAVLLGFTLFLSPSEAQAQFRLRVENVTSGEGVVITDNNLGDVNPMDGVVTFSAAIGDLIVNVSTGISKPLIGGTNNYAELDLNSVNVSVSGPVTLRLSLEDTGFTGGPDGNLILRADVGGTLTATAGSNITINSWVNPNNLVPDYGTETYPPGTLDPLGAIPPGSINAYGVSGVTSGNGAFAFTGSTGFVKNGPYSLFTEVTVVFTGPGTVSFDSNLQVLPAPGGLMLALAGLPAFGFRYLRRRLGKQGI